MCPMVMEAKVYLVKHGENNPNPRPRTPALYYVAVSVDYENGDLYISPNYNIMGLHITISQNNILYENTTVSLLAGQPYVTSVAGYDVGDYILTLENSDEDVIDQYSIIVEED